MNKVVLITGASSGIGAVTARVLAEKGFTVYGTYRSAPPKEAERLPYTPLYLDVSDESSIESALSAVIAKEGRLDVLVNNAGMGIAGPIELTAPDEAALQMGTNYLGALAVTRHALPFLRRSGGKILCISSLAARIPIPFQALYSASKAALEITMQALAMECRGSGLSCCCLELGDTRTGFTAHRKYVRGTQQPSDYETRFLSSIHKMERDEQNGMDPEKAARKIAALLQKKRMPELAFCRLQDCAIYHFRRLLPLRWSGALIARLYAK